MGNFPGLERAWQERAPLGWDVRNTEVVARTICALWSDWLPAVTGEVIHVDGGAHAIGSALAAPAERIPAPREVTAPAAAEATR
jgi:enoyl-[acyl-carrier protein] reductase I